MPRTATKAAAPKRAPSKPKPKCQWCENVLVRRPARGWLLVCPRCEMTDRMPDV